VGIGIEAEARGKLDAGMGTSATWTMAMRR